jgi:imidazolonepropionase-like amidohydrolase
MRLCRSLVLVALMACRGAAPAPSTPPATLAITGARVFDGERVLPATDVLIAGDTIVAVGPGLRIAPGVATVDGRGKTLLPGLIDAHTHVYDPAQLEQALAFGVTTELDMFAIPSMMQPLRASTAPDRADVRSAGSLATAPGGHGTEYGFTIPTISDAAEAQAFVDARLAEGSDYLKIVHDGGAAYGLTIPTVSEPVLRALVAAAHARGKLAVVHIGTAAEARAALEAGADGLVHLFHDAPDDDFGALAARQRAFVVPTLTVLRSLQGGTSPVLADAALAPYLDAEARENLAMPHRVRARSTPGTTEDAIAQLRAAGVPVLAGTDASNAGTAHGASMHDELELLVQAGLSPTAALAGATALPARAFGLDDRGRIAVGQRADLLLIDGDPTTTITATRAIVGIWRGGVAFDRAGYRARLDAITPE